MRGEVPHGAAVVGRAAVDSPAREPALGNDTAAPVDERAFGEVFREHAAAVARVLRRMGVADADLEDLTQEVFVVVYRRWHDFRGDSSMKTWICGIAAHKAMGHRRRRYVRDEVPLGDRALPDASGGQEQALEQLELRSRLTALLDRLEENKRAVFVLYELEELTMRDVAAVVEAPLHTCYSRLHAARSQLKAQMQRMAATEAR